MVVTLEKELEKLPVVTMASDWLKASEVMFWMFLKAKSCFHDTIFEPAEVWIVDDIERLRLAERAK